MTDLPLPHPLDDEANELLDAGLDAPDDAPALAEHLAELRAVREGMADLDGVTPAPDPARRERSILAALAAFDEQAIASAPAAPVVPIRVAAERRAARRSMRAWLPAAAAAAVLVVGVLGVRQISHQSGGSESGSAALSDGSALKNAGAETARAGDAAGGATSATTAAGAATTAAAATTRAASASTAAAASATTTARAATTVAVAPAATSAAAPSPTDIGLGARPYLGEIGSRAELDRAYDALRSATPPATLAGDSVGGREALDAAAGAGCPWGSFGTPLALLRWQGRPAVLVLGDLLRVVSFDQCTVVYERPA